MYNVSKKRHHNNAEEAGETTMESIVNTYKHCSKFDKEKCKSVSEGTGSRVDDCFWNEIMNKCETLSSKELVIAQNKEKYNNFARYGLSTELSYKIAGAMMAKFASTDSGLHLPYKPKKVFQYEFIKILYVID